jgi:tetratricopeptide (TPR) repeat protein
MAQLYRALYSDPGQPSLLAAPLEGLRRQVDGLRLDDIPLTAAGPGGVAARETMRSVLDGVRVRLARAKVAYNHDATTRGPDSAPAAPPSTVVIPKVGRKPDPTVPAVVLHLLAYDAYSANDISGAVDGWSAVIEADDATSELRAAALVNRGVLHSQQNRHAEALADYSRVIDALPGAPVEQVATALVNRGVLHGQQNRPAEELADYTRVIDALPGAPVEQIAKALVNRGVRHGQQNRPAEALADCSRVIDALPGAPVEQVATALVNRGVLHGQQNRPAEELADYTRVIDALPGAPVVQIAKALGGRGWFNYRDGDGDAAKFLSDTERALQFDGTIWSARSNHGLALLFAGRDAEALDRYREFITANPPPERILECRTDLGAALKKWLTPERAEPVLALFPKDTAPPK